MKLVRATASGVIPAFGITVTEGDQFWVPDDAYGAFEDVKTQKKAPKDDDVVAEPVLDLPEDGDPHSATSEPGAVDETATEAAAEPETASEPTSITTSEE